MPLSIFKCRAECCVGAGERHRVAQGSGSHSHLPLYPMDLLHPRSSTPCSPGSCGFDGGVGDPPTPSPVEEEI